MFGLFKKKPETALDGFIRTTYGSNTKKSADLKLAIQLAHQQLLQNCVPLVKIKAIAEKLNAGPMPYSTCDLAVSTALSFFKRPDLQSVLAEVQIYARMQVVEWLHAKTINQTLAMAFEETLYNRYKS